MYQSLFPIRKTRFTACIFFIAFTVIPSHAQFRTSIQGVVTDSTGAVIPGARLTLKDLSTNETLTRTSGPDGVYNFNALPAAPFVLTAEKDGFQKKVLDHLQLIPEQPNGINIQLELGGTSTTVTVNGDTIPAIDTETANFTPVTGGLRRISQWYFEVWNEPNIDFWNGSSRKQSSFELYAHTARDLKAVSPRLRVGGPVTAAVSRADDFLAFDAANHVPADFVSSHGYADDTVQNLFHSNEEIPMDDRVCRAIEKVQGQIKASSMPGLPLFWTEWNDPTPAQVEQLNRETALPAPQRTHLTDGKLELSLEPNALVLIKVER